MIVPFDYDGKQPDNSWWFHWLSDGRAQVVTRCTNGHIGSLEDHAIARDGTVSPSVVCQRPGCNFHEFIQLSDWVGRIKAPGERLAQENFFDAVRDDPDMTPEQKAYWLAMEPKTKGGEE